MIHYLILNYSSIFHPYLNQNLFRAPCKLALELFSIYARI